MALYSDSVQSLGSNLEPGTCPIQRRDRIAALAGSALCPIRLRSLATWGCPCQFVTWQELTTPSNTWTLLCPWTWHIGRQHNAIRPSQTLGFIKYPLFSKNARIIQIDGQPFQSNQRNTCVLIANSNPSAKMQQSLIRPIALLFHSSFIRLPILFFLLNSFIHFHFFVQLSPFLCRLLSLRLVVSVVFDLIFFNEQDDSLMIHAEIGSTRNTCAIIPFPTETVDLNSLLHFNL